MHIEDDEVGWESATPRGMGGMSVMLIRMDASLVRHTLAPVSAMGVGVDGKVVLTDCTEGEGNPTMVKVMSWEGRRMKPSPSKPSSSVHIGVSDGGRVSKAEGGWM